MLFLFHILIAIISLLIIIYSCTLFTNAIEHLGCKLKLGNNATGSILAVIGTGLPETIVPLVAIIGAVILGNDIEVGKDIALGAIIGSPFMLSTFALFSMGIFLIFKKRKNKELNFNTDNILRDYKYFLIAYSIAILSAFLPNKILKICAVFVLVFLYGVFVYRTIDKSKQCLCENILDELIFSKFFKAKNYLCFVILQLIFSIVILTLSVHFFVGEIEYFAKIYSLSLVVLSLIITPFATELPECVNSIIWLKNDKDDLALANVIGATVFQATIPFSIGILLTSWVLNLNILINACVVILASLMIMLDILMHKKIRLISLILAGFFYFGYLLFILV